MKHTISLVMGLSSLILVWAFASQKAVGQTQAVEVPSKCVKLCSVHEDAKATWIEHRGDMQCYCKFPFDPRFDAKEEN